MHPIIFAVLVTAAIGAIALNWLSAGTSLLVGIAIALVSPHPWVTQCRSYSAIVLKVAIVLMGFGMEVSAVAATAGTTFWITLLSLLLALILGWALMKLLKVDSQIGLMISSGTAICGGSAIAAVSQVIKPPAEKTVVAVTVIFLLNLIALYIFPVIGHWLELSQFQFGVWAALAIHDTSSVVGAAAQYGDQALNIASTAKLARALWIIPLTVILSLILKPKGMKVTIPLFIVFFVLAASSRSLIEANLVFDWLSDLSRCLLKIALLIMGLGITKQTLAAIDARPFALGVILWIALSISSLFLVYLIT